MKKLVAMLLLLVLVVPVAACGKKEEAVEVDLKALHQEVKDAYGEAYIPRMELDAETLEMFTGVTADMCEEFIADGPMMSAHVDMFIAIKAADGQADAVEEKLKDYRDYLINDSMQYPTNQVKVQASQVVRHDDYVFFVLLGEIPMEVEEQGDEAILQTAKDGVKIATDIIDGYFQ